MNEDTKNNTFNITQNAHANNLTSKVPDFDNNCEEDEADIPPISNKKPSNIEPMPYQDYIKIGSDGELILVSSRLDAYQLADIAIQLKKVLGTNNKIVPNYIN